MFSISLFSKKVYKYIDEKELLYEEYIYGLVRVVEKRDTYTAGHSERVAKYAEMIAESMGYSEKDCHIIHRAGMLHDIGKVAIPDSIFLKPTRLNEDEYKMIQEHVSMSYEMLKNISIFDEIREIVRDHHEHYDGSGYPRGLIGEDTPMLAQILTLADSFDAMTTDRIYKGRKSVKEALAEIALLSGKQFNPKVVQAALSVLRGSIIDQTYHQHPKTLLERERFSYFYKDALTDVFNEEYLRSDIDSVRTSPIVAWLSLHNFHLFNKKNGWSAGDELLKKLTSALKIKHRNSLKIYRFYGDNFLILLENSDEVGEIRDAIETLLGSTNIEYELKVNYDIAQEKESIERFEDVLKKLF
jgi:putative nucleotidyltransferase with HDIG domain/diguanylate cyclase (GGDEF)-like protein